MQMQLQYSTLQMQFKKIFFYFDNSNHAQNSRIVHETPVIMPETEQSFNHFIIGLFNLRKKI